MAVAGLIGGLVLGLVGTGIQVAAAKKQQEAQKQALNAAQQAELIRQQAMEADATRRRREVVRQGIIQRAQAQSATTSAGAESGSALGGAYGQVGNVVGTSIGGIEVNRSAGEALFSANRDMLEARKSEADAGFMSGLGQGISSLGGAFGRTLGAQSRMFGTGTEGRLF